MTNRQQARIWRRIGRAFERRSITGRQDTRSGISTDWGLCRAVFDITGWHGPDSEDLLGGMSLCATVKGVWPDLGAQFLWVTHGTADRSDSPEVRQASAERAMFAYLMAEYAESE